MNMQKRLGFEARLRQAVIMFWNGRSFASAKQLAAGRADQGNRGAVTGGKTMDSFRDMIVEVVKSNAPKGVGIYRDKSLVVLPGFFRPTKQWDLLVVHEGRLLAALELKSLCGPSFGNNANNRCEEALGSAYDFRQAQREGLFGTGAAPFLGYFILVEDAEGSRMPVRASSPHYPADPVFQGASYQTRMLRMCERMVQQQLYACASVLTAASDAGTGAYANLSAHTSFRHLLMGLASHLASEADAARSEGSLREEQAPYGVGLDGDYFESVIESKPRLADQGWAPG
jgi:hypothetical protein